MGLKSARAAESKFLLSGIDRVFLRTLAQPIDQQLCLQKQRIGYGFGVAGAKSLDAKRAYAGGLIVIDGDKALDMPP